MTITLEFQDIKINWAMAISNYYEKFFGVNPKQYMREMLPTSVENERYSCDS